jgi:hypothetical protein
MLEEDLSQFTEVIDDEPMLPIQQKPKMEARPKTNLQAEIEKLKKGTEVARLSRPETKIVSPQQMQIMMKRKPVMTEQRLRTSAMQKPKPEIERVETKKTQKKKPKIAMPKMTYIKRAPKPSGEPVQKPIMQGPVQSKSVSNLIAAGAGRPLPFPKKNLDITPSPQML